MSNTLQVKINNQIVTYTNGSPQPIRVTSDYPIITWQYEATNIVEIGTYGTIETIEEPSQNGYEIRISTYTNNIGFNTFIGNSVNTSFVTSENKFWNYVGTPLTRGQTYYGQIYIKDALNNTSPISTFAFSYNSLPYINNVKITPSYPSVSSDLTLTYNYYDDDDDIQSNTLIRWYKNSVRQKQFDNVTIVKSTYLQLNDTWFSEILPNDGYEYGARSVSHPVRISKIAPELSDIRIMPTDPNENDVIAAHYECSDLSEYDNVAIRWFINGRVVSKFNDQKYLRYQFSPGDSVHYEIAPTYNGSYVSSDTVLISVSDFVVYDIQIDGQTEPLDVSTVSPIVRWKIHKSNTREQEYVSIKIGTFYEADNIYPPQEQPELGIIETNNNFFNIPVNLLNKGVDYYISISVSDTQVFKDYTSAHFRIKGSRWDISADNAVGWTIETIFMIEQPESFDASKYQIIRFHDGSKFGEVRIHNGKIGFVSNTFTVSEQLVTTGFNILTIVGKENDIKIYLNRKLVIDGTGLLTQNTTIGTKQLELGNSTNTSFNVKYKYFYYTTSGAYYPDSSIEYSNIQFYKFLTFENNEIVALKGYVSNLQDYKIFGVNPDQTDESGSVYAIVPEYAFRAGAVSRTFMPINKIRRSPDGTKIVCAHGHGATIITGYTINPFDMNLNFVVNSNEYATSYPDNNGWDLVQNTANVNTAYFDIEGLHINTLT